MGFFKKLKRVAGKALKGAVKLAPALGLPGAGAIGAVALSKLKTAGAHKLQLRAAAKGKLASAIGKAPRVQAMKLTGSGTKTLGDIANVGPKLSPAAKIKINAGAGALLDTSSDSQKVFRAQKSARETLAKRAAGLSQDDWKALAEEYERSGKKGSWEAFVGARI